MLEQSPVETITIGEPADRICGNCRHSIPSPIASRVLCFIRGDHLNPKDSCCRWQVRPA